MKKVVLTLLFLMSELTSGQIANGGFEVWDTTYVPCYKGGLINFYAVPDPYGGIANRWTFPDFTCGSARTSDSYSGNYALLLYNWYYSDYGKAFYSDSINFRPQYFQGYFKYVTGGSNGLSHGTAEIVLTKFNGTFRDTIATGTYQFDSTVVYTPFQVDLNYVSTLVPDSIFISIINGNHYCEHYAICNLLYLDGLALSNSPLGIKTINSLDADIKVCPNPFSKQAILQTDKIFKDATLTVHDLSGKLVKQIKNISGHTFILNRGKLSTGLYFIRITQNHKIIGVEKIAITD